MSAPRHLLPDRAEPLRATARESARGFFLSTGFRGAQSQGFAVFREEMCPFITHLRGAAEATVPTNEIARGSCSCSGADGSSH